MHSADTLQGHLITTAIASRGEDAEAMEMHLEEEIMAAMPKINRLLWVLDTSVTIAPLLGLFGTIIGMIQAFNVLAVNGGPAKVTGGIADALVSTGAGLLIAIIAVYFVNYFNNSDPAHRASAGADQADPDQPRAWQGHRRRGRAAPGRVARRQPEANPCADAVTCWSGSGPGWKSCR